MKFVILELTSQNDLITRYAAHVEKYFTEYISIGKNKSGNEIQQQVKSPKLVQISDWVEDVQKAREACYVFKKYKSFEEEYFADAIYYPS